MYHASDMFDWTVILLLGCWEQKRDLMAICLNKRKHRC